MALNIRCGVLGAWIILLLVVSANAQMTTTRQAQGCVVGQPTRPSAPASVARTINVHVPVPYPGREAAYSGSPGYGCRPGAVTPVRPSPVRVEVSVRPEPSPQRGMVPLVHRDPGPFVPVLAHSAGFAGAVLAFPFRLLETMVPLPCSTGPGQAPPPSSPRTCDPRQGSVTTPTAGQGPWCGPLTCAPTGPSVAPLPKAPAPDPCGPYIPARVVSDSMYPCVEPNSLLGGILGFPARLLGTGRVWGDLWGDSPPQPR